jgi:hypothetical protein
MMTDKEANYIKEDSLDSMRGNEIIKRKTDINIFLRVMVKWVIINSLGELC